MIAAITECMLGRTPVLRKVANLEDFRGQYPPANECLSKVDQAVSKYSPKDGRYLDLSRLDLAPLSQIVLGNEEYINLDRYLSRMVSPEITQYPLQNANFSNSNLYGICLVGANMIGASFKDALLDEGNFIGANLAEANLTGANLYGADFTGANLTNVNLTGVRSLQCANFQGATLTGAYLIDDSTGQRITGQALRSYLSKMYVDDNTRF